jgi:hypothetical protein
MPTPAPLCTHVMTSGLTCGSPAVSGTALCYHHSAIKTALGKPANGSQIPFVFPEDSTSLQINYFLLLQAYTQGRVDLRNFNSMQRLLRSMAANLGKMPLAHNHAACADEAPAEVPENEATKQPAAQQVPARRKLQPHRSTPVPQDNAQPKPYPSFEEIVGQLKPLGSECFLNIPSPSNSLPGLPLTR